MKAGWAIKTIGDIVEVKGGKRVPNGYKLLMTLTDHPYITVSDFSDSGTINESALRYIENEVFEQIKKYTISSKDIYISIAGTIGKTGFIPESLEGANLTENACKLVLKPEIDRDFVYYFTQTEDFKVQVGVNTRTAAQPKLALERLKTISISIPENVHEQQRIVAILDKTFEQIAIARANTEKNLKNARALFESHLQSVFIQRDEGYAVKTFDEVLEIKNGKDQKPVEKDGGKYPIYGSAGNVMGWTDAYICNEQKTIIGRKGTINRPIFIETKFWNVDTAFGLAAKPNLNAKFLYFFCLSYDFSLHNRGTTIPSLVKTDLLNIKISVPSLTIQEQLVEKFSALHKETKRLESIYQRKLTALDALKKSLLYKAFAGEL